MAEPVTVVLTSNPLTVGRAYPATWNPKPMKSPMQPPDIPKESCHADPVLSAPLGSHDGQPSHGPALEDCLILSISSLVKAMASSQMATFDLIQAINRLASSNEALVQAMAEGAGMADDDDQPGSYLNGSPVR